MTNNSIVADKTSERFAGALDNGGIYNFALFQGDAIVMR
jgi:hypothetical protein